MEIVFYHSVVMLTLSDGFPRSGPREASPRTLGPAPWTQWWRRSSPARAARFLTRVVQLVHGRPEQQPHTFPFRGGLVGIQLFDSTCWGRDPLDTLNEVGLAERALRFEKVQYLEQQFVHGGIFDGEMEQRIREIEALL
jgi:hypothetical protein